MAKRNKAIYLGVPHKYNFGSFMQGMESGKGLGKFGSQYAGLSSGMQGTLGGLGNMVGKVAGGAISGGLESGAGNVMSGLSNVASAIPGPWGAIASAGLGVVGGLVNAAFGIKEDKEKHQRLDQATNYLNTFNSNASTFDEIQGPEAMFLDSDVYRGGWFSKGKARRKNQELAFRAQSALDKANRDVVNNVTTLTKGQMDDLEGSYFSLGGPLHTHGADWMNGITIIGNGGSHESNPFEGVPMGIAPDGQPNLVEEGEVIFNDYVFSNRIKVPKAVREKYKLRGQKEMTFADAAKKAQKESEERPNDPISQRGLEDIMNRLMIEQETIRERKNMRQYSEGGKIHIAPSKRGTFTAAASKHGMGVQEFASKVLANPEDYSPAMRKKANFARNASKWKHALGGPIKPFDIPEYEYGKYVYKFDDTFEPKQYKPTPISIDAEPLEFAQQSNNKSNNKRNSRWFNPTILRYAPALGAGIGVLTDIFGITNRPDYTNADTILNTARESTKGIRDVTFKPIGNYLTYKPFDTLFYANQLGAQAGATRRAITDNSNGNRGAAVAGLLAADYNAQNQLGNLFRQAEEYNLAQREKVENFNRGTNEFNSEGLLKAAIANAENAQQKAKINLTAAERAAAIRDAVDTRVSNARSANLTNLFDNLGNIGRESYVMNMIRNNPALLYDWLGRYKGKAKGGYLTIKRRR